MKTKEKITFRKIKGVLSREEMKIIMAGSGGYDYWCCNDMQYCFSGPGPALDYCYNTPGCSSCRGFTI